MNFKTILRKLLIHSAASASLGALSNAIGSRVLTACNYEGHDLLESVAIASSGAALFAALLDLSFHLCISEEITRTNSAGEFSIRLLWSYLFTQLLGPSVGWLMFSDSEFMKMSYGQYEADAAVGMAICILPFCSLFCTIAQSNDAPYEEAYKKLMDESGLTNRKRLADCYNGDIPEIFLSSISLEIMNDPMILHCGHNFDLEDLPSLSRYGSSCPCCRAPFRAIDFTSPTPNIILRDMISDFVDSKVKMAGHLIHNPEIRVIEVGEANQVEAVFPLDSPSQIEKFESPGRNGAFGYVKMNEIGYENPLDWQRTPKASTR